MNPAPTRDELAARLRAGRAEFRLLESGEGWALMCGTLGARLLGAGVGPENALWTAPGLAAGRGGAAADWNAGGQRTWLAPEAGPQGFFFGSDGAFWGVPPELDPGAYTAVDVPGWPCSFRTELTLRRADGRSFELALTRSLRLEPAGRPGVLRIAFRHELANRGGATLPPSVGLWSITQVPAAAPGTLIIPVRPGPGEPVRPYFTELPPGSVRSAVGVVCMRALGGRKYKAGVGAARAESSPAEGRIAHVRRDRAGSGWIVVATRFPVDPNAAYVDKPTHTGAAAAANGDPIQAYNSPETGDEAFAEIECHAPARALSPGESAGFEISIAVISCTDAELGDMLQREVTPRVSRELLFSD